jgi:ribosomal protein L24
VSDFDGAKVVVTQEGPDHGKIGRVFDVDGERLKVLLIQGVKEFSKEEVRILPSNL